MVPVIRVETLKTAETSGVVPVDLGWMDGGSGKSGVGNGYEVRTCPDDVVKTSCRGASSGVGISPSAGGSTAGSDVVCGADVSVRMDLDLERP